MIPAPLLFLVNDPDELGPTMTTSLLIHEAGRREAAVAVASVRSLEVTDAAVQVRACRLRAGATVQATLARLRAAPVAPERLAHFTVVVRTNPARDPRSWAHRHLLDVLRLAQARGVRIINDPEGLSRATSKLYLSSYPTTVRPETLISSDPAALRAFCAQRDAPTILKPLEGTRGRDVFRIDPGEVSNLNQILDVLTRDGVALAQEWLPEGREGDTRIILLDGRILEEGGHACAVWRRPPLGDFRSNVAIGGEACPATLTAAQRSACALIGARLVAEGLRLVGLDLIGARAVEINVFSTGGLHDAGRFGGVDFAPAVIDAFTR